MQEEKLRTVYLVEVMEDKTEDLKLEVWGTKEDADKSFNAYRDRGRKVRRWVESVLWS